MSKTDVLIIGGSAAGIAAAVTGKKHYPEKDFLLIRKENQALVPCGIPYIFGTLGCSDKNIMPEAVITKAGVTLKTGEVVSVNLEGKTCRTAEGEEITFEKLVLATGSLPLIPKWLNGAELENVFTIKKDKEYLDDILVKLEKCQNIVTIGGGFIGVEMSDELMKQDKNVTLVEILPHILDTVFDKELTVKAEEILSERGVNIITGTGVKEIRGDSKVSGVLLDNGEILQADAVILSMGYRPNVRLAEEAGIKINELGFVEVDEFMRSANPDIFAVGDCAGKRDFATNKLTGIMLASIACAEGRIAGANLFGLSTTKTCKGTIPIFSTVIGDTAFGVAGFTENVAQKEGFDIITGKLEGIDKHPGTLPGTNKTFMKLIVARKTGIILGGEIIGGPSTGELINLIGLAIQNQMTVDAMWTTQIGTHPLLNTSPIAYTLINLADMIARELK